MEADFVKDLSGFTGHASLYRMVPPLKGYSRDDDDEAPAHEYVVASAVANGWVHETYLLPADADGKVTDWGELPGSVKGTTDHHDALSGAGYDGRRGD